MAVREAPSVLSGPVSQYSGVPSSEVQLWLDNVQEQLRHVRADIEAMQVKQAKLQEQESLLLELLTAVALDSV